MTADLSERDRRAQRREGDRALMEHQVDWTLVVVLVGFRGVAAAWLTILGAIALFDGVGRPWVVWTAILLAWAWAGATAAAARVRPQAFLGAGWLIPDLVVGLATLAAPLLDGASQAVNFSGGYPMSSILLWTYVWGVPGAALSSGFASAIIFANTGQSFNGRLTTVIVYVVTAAVVAWGLGVLRRNEVARLAAEEALIAERAERVRTEERAEMAAHIHDSVLQTLALIQRRAGDPQEVAALARQQERQLRDWLYTDPAAVASDSLAAAVAALGTEIEARFPVRVDVVTVGDAVLGERLIAVVHAAREALTNAAKFSGAGDVAVYAEVADRRVSVFVRDRGAGFEPAAVGAGRRGIADSIVGRMERHGGKAEIRSAPGHGTEVELTMDREGADE